MIKIGFIDLKECLGSSSRALKPGQIVLKITSLSPAFIPADFYFHLYYSSHTLTVPSSIIFIIVVI